MKGQKTRKSRENSLAKRKDISHPKEDPKYKKIQDEINREYQ